MFKPFPRFVLIAVSAAAFFASAGSPANAGQTDPAGSVAAAAASAREPADCQAPATVGEDYAGISCVGSAVDLPAVLAPFYPMGEDFSGMVIVAWPKDSAAATHRLTVVRSVPTRAPAAGRDLPTI